jgi:hypothetical protein
MYRCGVGSGPLKVVQGREFTSVCDGQIRTAVISKDDCLKLHHVGYLIHGVMMHGTTNIKK